MIKKATLIFSVLIFSTAIFAQEKKEEVKLTKEEKKAIKTEKKLLKKIAKGMTETESGLKYKITQEGSGEKPQKNDVVKVHYTGTRPNGEKFDSSYDRGTPLPLKLGVGMVIKGWDEGIALLNEGSKATFLIPPHLGYGEKGSEGRGVKGYIIFDVELVEIVKPYDTTGIKPIVTESGLKVYKINETEGEMPEKGKTVVVNYTGTLEDGTKFDSSWDRMRPFTFPLGMGRVIKGWDEGIAMLKKGEKAKLVIPSNLGYGNRGAAGGKIPGGATLIFDVELVDFK